MYVCIYIDQTNTAIIPTKANKLIFKILALDNITIF